ncbi:unnamed protein product, partial [Brassica rapa]
CSHGWRGLLEGRDLLVSKLSFVIGNGEGIKVWSDHWLSTECPSTPYGPAPEQYQDLVVADLLSRETKEWNVPLLETLFPQLVETIVLLKPSKTGGQDGYAWLGARSGTYSTRSGYYAAIEHTLEQPVTT